MPGRSGIAGLPACDPQPVGQFGHSLWQIPPGFTLKPPDPADPPAEHPSRHR